MKLGWLCGILAILAVTSCALGEEEDEVVWRELLLSEFHGRYTRQTPSVDTCILGCIIGAVRNVGLGNVRPASWSWNLSDLFQSAILRTYCDAYTEANNCIRSCSLSGTKILVSALMGVPGLLCTGSSSATACLQNATKSVQSTCDNKCIELKPSFGMSTWLSLTKMSNIFNDMCSYWGCQLTCAKPAVDSQCGQESVSLYNRITGIGLDTLKNALKTAGLATVCGANATRVPHTYEVRTDSPIINGPGDGQGGRPGDDYGDGNDNRPPTDSEEGDGFGRPGEGQGGRGQGGGDGQGGGESSINLGGGQDGGTGQQRGAWGARSNSTNTTRTSGGGRGTSGGTLETATTSGRRGGSERGPGRGRGGTRTRTTTTEAYVDEPSNIGDEDYWNTLSHGGRGGRGGTGGSNRGSPSPDRSRGGGFREGDNEDDVPPPRSSGASRGQRWSTPDGLGDLNQKRRPTLVTTTESSWSNSWFQSERNRDQRRNNDADTPTMRVQETDQRTGEVHVRLGD